jgi:hypothetical protein
MSSGRPERAPCLKRALTSIEKFADSSVCVRSVVNALGVDRESQILASSSEWILFLDEDCEIPSRKFFEKLSGLTRASGNIAIFGGLYLDPPKATYGTQAYNRLCNLWVLKSQTEIGVANLLGGCLLVHATAIKSEVKKNPIRWGGEDTFLLRSLQRAGFVCRLERGLSVIHSPPRAPWSSFFRRAFLHGKHRERFSLHTTGMSFEGWKYLLLGFRFWPFWALHFLALRFAAISQNIGQADR